jgi:hypothetical protein
MEDVLRIRRQISRRLMKAKRAGRLTEEREAIEREAEVVSRRALNGSVNGRTKHRK